MFPEQNDSATYFKIFLTHITKENHELVYHEAFKNRALLGINLIEATQE